MSSPARRWAKRLVSAPVLGPIALTAVRARRVLPAASRPLMRAVPWLFTSKELTNFTYHLEERNVRYLAALISDVVGAPVETIEGYISELQTDEALRTHIASVRRSAFQKRTSGRSMPYGRRLGWYALARAIKPRVVVETGVDKGLGGCVVVAALNRNRAEGFEGKYFGTDINPEAGYLLRGDYARNAVVLYGDSKASLGALEETVDLFVNDSDHSAAYEADEYRVVAPKLARRAVIIGDNAHATDELLRFSLESGRRFLYFQEEPRNHWYRGAGLGVSFVRENS